MKYFILFAAALQQQPKKQTKKNTLSEISSSQGGGVCVFVCYSASTANMAKLEEMERLLREAQAEKRSLLEHKVTSRIFIWLILFIYLKMKYKNLTLLANTGSSSHFPSPLILVVLFFAVSDSKL